MVKLITLYSCMVICCGCARGERSSMELNVYIDPQMSFVSIEKKVKYREEMDEYNESIRNPNIFSIFKGRPAPPVPIHPGDLLWIVVGDDEYPIHLGDNKVIIMCRDDDELRIRSTKVNYKVSEIRNRNTINIKIVPGSDILSL